MSVSSTLSNYCNKFIHNILFILWKSAESSDVTALISGIVIFGFFPFIWQPIYLSILQSQKLRNHFFFAALIFSVDFILFWRRLLRFPWTTRRSNKSILKEINPEYSLEGLMLKLKFQYFGHLMPLIGKDSAGGKDWGQEEKGMTEDEMVRSHQRLNGDEFEQTPGDGKVQGSLACCSPWGRKESDTTEQQNNNKP